MSADVLHFPGMAEYPNRIKEIREALGWSQETLADHVGCSKMQISALERGVTVLNIEWMRRIGRAMSVLPADLLNPEDNPLRLDERERQLVGRFRAADPNEKVMIERVTEAVKPFRGKDAA